jgi:hypothetical protein
LTPPDAPVDHRVVADPKPGNVVSRGIQFAVQRRIGWAALPKGYDLRHPKASYFDWNLPPLSDASKSHKPADGLDIDEDDLGEGGGEGGEGATKPMDRGDKELVPVKNRWIYAFETGYGDKGKIGLLSREYHADDKGKLTFVDGGERRRVDATEDSEPKGQPINDAGLPHARQSEHCHYVFVGTRGRLCKDAIADLERNLSGPPESWGMPSIYKPINLGDSLPTGADGTPFALVIDPLTLGETLGRSYRRALNWGINLAVPHGENPIVEKAKTTALKYQLGKMMRDSLLHEGRDALDIKPHLVNNGELMLHFLAKHEGDLSTVRRQVAIQVAALIVFLNSDIWSQAHRWYFGPKNPGPTTTAGKTIGHFFKASETCCKRRFNETDPGWRQLMKDLDAADGPMKWLYEPEPHSHARETYEQWHQVIRKTFTTKVLGIAEYGPILKASRKVADANALINRTLASMFPLTNMKFLKSTKGRNLLARLLKHDPQWHRVMVHSQTVLNEVQHWIDKEGKVHWPHGTKFAKPAEVLSLLLAGVELINLVDKFQLAMRSLARQAYDENRKSTLTVAMEMTVASLDVLVAAEEPIREFGLYIADGSKAETVVKKLLSPGAFKVMGGVSSALEAVVAFMEAHEAAERGERGLSMGYRTVGVGAGLAAVGSFMAVFLADPIAFPLLSAASMGLIVVGVAAVAIGYMVVACLTTTAWQSFAAHCVFGTKVPIDGENDGKTTWSGGEFHEWKENPEGLELQIRALTAMICGFSMRGEGSKGANSVRITFGSLPPNAKLQIQFELKLDDKTVSRPGYLIDLEGSGLVHTWGGPEACRQLTPSFDEKGRLKYLVIAPLWPEGRWATDSECWAVIQYAPQGANAGEGAATGTIPIHGNFNYKIVESGRLGIAHMDVLESIDAKEKH